MDYTDKPCNDDKEEAVITRLCACDPAILWFAQTSRVMTKRGRDRAATKKPPERRAVFVILQ
jgi:hypothetical protein